MDLIEQLTQPTLTNDPPADVIGVDGNGVLKGAYHGEYLTADGWRSVECVDPRNCLPELGTQETVLRRAGCVARGIASVAAYTPIVRKPDDPIFMAQGGDPIPSQDALERRPSGNTKT